MFKNLRFVMTLVISALCFHIAGAQEAYTKQSLLDAGWTEITALPEALGDYFYVIEDATNDLMLGAATGANQGSQYKAAFYQTAVNPVTDFSKVWVIEKNGDAKHSFRNLEYRFLQFQTEGNAGHNFRTHDQPKSCEWTALTLAYSADANWTIQNGKYPEAGFLGPWNEPASANLIDGAETALNKQGDNVGHYKIYSISKKDFATKYIAAVGESVVNLSFLTDYMSYDVNLWTKEFEGFTQNFQSQGGNNKDTGEYSNNRYLEAWNNGVTFTGTLKSTLQLPEGEYTITAYGFKETGDVITFVANGKSVALNNDNNLYQKLSLNVDVAADGKLEFGYEITGGTWIGLTGVQLVYGSALTVVKNAYNAALEAAQAIDQTTLNTAAKTQLQDAIAATPAETEEGYNAAIAALEEAVKVAKAVAPALVEANAFIASCEEIVAKSTTEDEALRTALNDAIAPAKTAVDAAVNATAIAEAVAALEAARQAYVVKSYPTDGCVFDMTFLVKNANASADLEGWTLSGPGGANGGQHWSGDNANRYLEPCDWGASSWTSSVNQVVVIPNGVYTVQAAGRASGTAVTLNLVAGGAKAQFPSLNDVGGTIATDGTEWESIEAGIAAGKTFTNNNAGRGWTYATVANILVTTGELTIGAEASSTAQYQWCSVDDFKLYLTSEIHESSNLDFSQGVVYTSNVKLDPVTVGEVKEWTSNCTSYWCGAAVFAYGATNTLNNAVVPATNSLGVAEGNALGLAASWGGTPQFTQKVTLPAGAYEITVPVYNAKGNASAPSKSLIGFIADNGTEYLADAKIYPLNTWTTETIRFVLDETTNGVLSLGYTAKSETSNNMPHLFFDYVEVKAISEADYYRYNLVDAIAAANVTVEAKANVGNALFMIPVATYDAYVQVVADAQTVADNTNASAEDVKGAIEALAAATAAYKVNAPEVGVNYLITQNASGFNLAIVDGAIQIADGAALQFAPAENGAWYITDGTSYINYANPAGNSNTWSITATADKADTWTIAANAEGLYTITGRNGQLGTDNVDAGSKVWGNKSGELALWKIAEDLENITADPENGSTVATDLTAIDIVFATDKFVKLNAENTNPIVIVDAEGNAVELAGAQLVAYDGVNYAYKLTNGDAPIFAAEGTYTVKIPAGKFLIGADEASATTLSKTIKLTYTVVEKKLIVTPASGASVDALESIELNFQGYDYMDVDANVDWNISEPRKIVIKKGDEVIKESAFDSWGEIESVNYMNILKINLGITEAGTYTIEIPEGKFCNYGGEDPYPATTLTYTVLGYENVTALNPKDGGRVNPDLAAVTFMFNDAEYAKLNAENTDAVTVTDADGNSVELAGATFVHLGENGYNLTNGDAPIFSAEGTYTIYVPAGKFFLGADEANATTASKAFKFTYEVVEKKVVANPANESAVPALESVELTFEGYFTNIWIDNYFVEMMGEGEAKAIVVKKDGADYKSITAVEYEETSQEYPRAIALKNLGLTEAGTYTLEFPAGKFTTGSADVPAFTLTYTVEGYQDVTADPADGSTVTTDMMSFAVTFNGATTVAQNEEAMYDPIYIYDENGEYAGTLRNAAFDIAGNVVTVKNEGWSGASPIFQNAGTYTLEFPKGKFLVDEAASKVFKLTYVVEAAAIPEITYTVNPASGSVVKNELLSVEFTFPNFAAVDQNNDGTMRLAYITKEGMEEPYAVLNNAAIEYGAEYNQIVLNTNITEPGTYTIMIAPGMFCVGTSLMDPPTIPVEELIQLTYTIEADAPATGTKTEMVVEAERIVNLGYAADVVEVDMAKICETLGVESIAEATVWGVNATTMEYIANHTQYDGWRNADGDFTTWGNNNYVCYKYMADGNFQLCTEPGNEPALGTVYNAYWAFTTATDTVVLKTVITFVEAPKVEVETVKTITINTTADAYTAYKGTTATFDVAEVCEALGIETLDGVETYIVNATTGEFVMNTTDGWRDANGDAAAWNTSAGQVCVKINIAEGTFWDIMAIDTSIEGGTVYTAKWAIVANGKAVVLDVVIEFVTPVGINGIAAEDIVKTEYFGMNGAALNAPVKGINIVKYTLVDGKVITAKVYVK